MPVGGEQTLDRTLDRYTRAGLPEIYDQQNLRTTARDNTGQHMDKGHTHPVPGQKLKFLTSLRIEPGPRLEGRDSTDHTMATDNIIFFFVLILYYWLIDSPFGFKNKAESFRYPRMMGSYSIQAFLLRYCKLVFNSPYAF